MFPSFQSENKEKVSFYYSTVEFRNTAALTSIQLLSTTGISVSGYLPSVGDVAFDVPSVYFEPSKTEIQFNAKAVGDCLNGATANRVFLPYLLKNWGVISGTTATFLINGVQRAYNMQPDASKIELSEVIKTINMDNLQVQVADYSYYTNTFFEYAAGAQHYARLLLQLQINVFKK
jgi:hypothetical protein